jgi:LmbE family N-acetylglucosaminyl deacetylase
MPATDSRPASRLDGATLVVAHPDDEILWFSSIIDRVDRIVICYLDVHGDPTMSQARRRVARDYPLNNVTFLGVTQARVYLGADWLGWPVVTESGLAVGASERTYADFNPQRYVPNYHELVERLRECLAGVKTVITHNPWGEYGHEEHVQVYRAVMSVQKTCGFDVWYSNYCSDRSYRLMLLETHCGFGPDLETLQTQPSLVSDLEALYREAGCWTWAYDDYVYFPNETFIRHDDSRRGRSYSASTVPLNFIRMEHLPRRPAPPPNALRRVVRSVKRRVTSASRLGNA